jgi:hypothetical protein
MIYPKENIVCIGVLQIFHPEKTDAILRTLHLTHDGISFDDKILQNKRVILGQELTENNLRK